MVRAVSTCLFLVSGAVCSSAEDPNAWASFLVTSSKLSPSDLDGVARDVQRRSRQKFLQQSANKAQVHPSAARSVASPMPSKCPDCSRLYLGCPVGWDQGEEGLCSAPANFATDCNRVQNFAVSDEASKIEAEETCGICWPCEDGSDAPTCTRDYSDPCPAGYVPLVSATGVNCIATPEYTGPCPATTAVLESDEERAEFASRCATSWPCEACPPEGNGGVCPKFWTRTGEGACAAPAFYKEAGCPVVQDMEGWSASARREFAARCRVRWHCNGADTLVPGSSVSAASPSIDMPNGPV